LKAAIGPVMINLGRFQAFAQSPTKYSARAIDLVRRSTVIDMLNPFSLAALTLAQNPVDPAIQQAFAGPDGKRGSDWLIDPASFKAADRKRFLDSGFTVMHIAAGTVGPNAYDSSQRFVSLWNGFIAHHSDFLMRVDSPESLDVVKSSGKLGIIVGLQNAEHFRTLRDVDLFYQVGQRVSQLTYNTRNMIGNGSTERSDSGLSDFGVSVVERMNRIGMAVDVSHCGDQTTMDACSVSKQPVLFTHSNCRAISGHVRAKTDEAIQKMAATGGVMGITGVRMFVSAKEPTTIEDVLDHYDRVMKLVGVEHVGIGSDIGIDGYGSLPDAILKAMHAGQKPSYGFRGKDDIEGLDHALRTYDLTEGLIRRRYTDAQIEAILGGNFKRVLKQIWQARS
jgi:membrane dipeptidase